MNYYSVVNQFELLTKDTGCEFYHPEYHIVTPEIAEEAAAYNIGINACTVNTVEDMQQMIDRHVTAIIGNYPDLATQVMRGGSILVNQ